jgi:PAS domain S-box-containing protein
MAWTVEERSVGGAREKTNGRGRLTSVNQAKVNAVAKSGRAKSRRRARILLVDDDERNLLALSEVLEDLAEVVSVTSGKDALRALLKGDFAVILLDVFMPGMDGYETASLIRAREQTARIPIIFLSAVNKEIEHLMRGYAMGAVDYVFKPVEPLMLQSKVGVFVDLYDVRRQVEERSRAEKTLLDQALRANQEKLEAERALRAAEERHSLAIRSLPIILFARDLARTMTPPRIIGGDLARMTGFDQPPSLDDWRERIHPDDRAHVADAYRRLPDVGNVAIEYRWRREDGEHRHFLEHTMLFGDGARDPIEIAGTIFDVTEQKQLEEKLVQAGKMEAIGQLTGGVAHDFNNLLAAVLGGIHVLERRLELDDRNQQIVDQIRHAAEHGAELVRRMMAFARKQDLVPTSVDPGKLCVTVAGLVEHTLGGTISISWQCAESESNLFVDKSQLELALLNLILNARDAMPEGGKVTVAIDALEEADLPTGAALPPGDYLRIRVADKGAGIAQGDIEKITRPFYTTKEAGKGTGLGLSMVLGFVQQSGGRLMVTSELGVGTCVEMILPSTRRQVSAKAKRKQATATTSARSILLVDDDVAVRTVVSEQLRELGFDVVAARDGADAINSLDNGTRFDVLLSDFAMPGINGLQTINRIKSLRPGIRSALMTGYADESLASIDRNEIKVFRKPIDIDDLLEFLTS